MAYDAGVQLGMMLTPVYLVDYFVQPELLGEIQHALNRGEAMHTLQRAIFDGAIPNDLAKRDESLAGVSLALSLLSSNVIAWSAEGMQAALDRIRAAGEEPPSKDLRRIAPPTSRQSTCEEPSISPSRSMRCASCPVRLRRRRLQAGDRRDGHVPSRGCATRARRMRCRVPRFVAPFLIGHKASGSASNDAKFDATETTSFHSCGPRSILTARCWPRR